MVERLLQNSWMTNHAVFQNWKKSHEDKPRPKNVNACIDQKIYCFKSRIWRRVIMMKERRPLGRNSFIFQLLLVKITVEYHSLLIVRRFCKGNMTCNARLAKKWFRPSSCQHCLIFLTILVYLRFRRSTLSTLSYFLVHSCKPVFH